MAGFIEWLLDLQDIRIGGDAPLAVRWSESAEACTEVQHEFDRIRQQIRTDVKIRF